MLMVADESGMLPIHWLCTHDADLDLVDQLMLVSNHGGDLSLMTKDNLQNLSPHCAARYGSADLCQFMIEEYQGSVGGAVYR